MTRRTSGDGTFPASSTIRHSGLPMTSDSLLGTSSERIGEVSDAAPQRSRALDLSGRTILLATDGSVGAAAGSHIALALATQEHATIRVVSVIDAGSAPVHPSFDMALGVADEMVGTAVHEDQEQNVRATISATTGHEIDWPVRIMFGAPASSIVREARRVKAVLIIVGLRRHGAMDRATNDETSLNVMRMARCPVLGVVPGTTALPRRAVCAIDFGETSLLAARTARAVVGAEATLVLAYVSPPTGSLPEDSESIIHDLGVEAGFARTQNELGDDGITLDDVVLLRPPASSAADAILDYAEATNCDLITAGSARRRTVERWMVGSVSTDLVRDGRRSVLIVPPRERVRREA